MTGTTKPSGIPWIGDIPVDWEVDEIRYKFKQVKLLNYQGVEDNLLSLSYGRIIQKDIESAFGLLPESFDTYNIIENGDIVLRLTDLQNDQKSLRVGFSEQRGIITSAYLTLRLAGEGDAKFFYYLLHAYDLQKVFYGMGAGVRQGLNWDELKRLSVIFPNAIEQKAIADLLDEECGKIDLIIADMERQVEILKAYKRAVITEVVTNGLNRTVPLKDSGVPWIGLIPTHWTVKPFKHCVKVFNGREYADIEVEDGDYPVMGSGGEFARASKCLYSKPSVLLGRKGTIDRPLFVDFPFWAVDTMFYTEIKPSMHPKFIYYLACQIRFDYYFTFTAIPSMTQKDLGSEKLAIPPLDEQQAIADYLDDECEKIDAIIKDKQAAVDTSKEYKKSLIYEYVTGKKRVKEAQ